MTCPVIEHETNKPCGQPVHRDAMCRRHYWRAQHDWSPERLGAPYNAFRDPKPTRTCPIIEDTTAAECGDDAVASGLCGRHYARRYNGWADEHMGLPRGSERPRVRPQCPIVMHETAEPCGRKLKAAGLCQLHWRRVRAGWPEDRLGEPMTGTARCGARTNSGPCKTHVSTYGDRCTSHPVLTFEAVPKVVAFARRSFEPTTDPAEVLREAKELTEAYRNAPETASGHTYQWKWFTQWCERAGVAATVPVPFETVALYLASMTNPAELDPQRGRSTPFALSTTRSARATIRNVHIEANLESPTDDPRMVALWNGVKRTLATVPVATAPAITREILTDAVDAGDDDDPLWIRDRAFMLAAWHRGLGYADWSVLRWGDGSDLTATEQYDLRRTPPGWDIAIRPRNVGAGAAPRLVTLRPSKDPRLCAVRALDAWSEIAEPVPGAIAFASMRGPFPLARQAASNRIKRALELASIPDAHRYSNESLVEGFNHAAIAAGAEADDLTPITGRSLATTDKRVNAARAHEKSRALANKMQSRR
mgnify:CR=1 FL=1